MMKIFLLILFLTPLIMNWWLFMFGLMLIVFILTFFSSVNFYINMSFGYGMDIISYCMILLTIWIIFLMIMASIKIYFLDNYYSEFLFVLLILMIFLLLSFSTSNLFLFYLYFESSMIPTLLLIFGWGYQPERFVAGLYLLFYTLFASFPLLICIFYIYNNYFTLFYFLIELDFVNYYIYLSLILAFLFKMPMFSFHFWLPKAHVEAPVSGSMILAGVLLKLGGYGLYRVFMFLDNFICFNYFWIVLSLFGGVLVGLLCLNQVDIKSMIAYSSVAHMGLVISGIMTCSNFGLEGSLILMIGHGLCSSGLFVLANILYERSYSRSLFINKGYINLMPSMSLFWFFFCINNMSSPFSLNFFGEIFLIIGVMSWSSLSMLFLAFSSFLSCCYSIYLYSITQHGLIYCGLINEMSGNIREFMLLFFHLFPLNLLFLISNMYTMWF
uniref:NADH-ubiquinone oxidoreductase chain 4 n=1 Tax=Planusocoris schaeferi TaxID=2924051 RepID=A0A8T9EJM0_9HEMI|nr:NADH dehydrogenase subunit 4 [Planusocoris schaeferi]UNA71169.1 NADH dehydrogenase subunit 4 [Planusocoris schaeferi]